MGEGVGSMASGQSAGWHLGYLESCGISLGITFLVVCTERKRIPIGVTSEGVILENFNIHGPFAITILLPHIDPMIARLSGVMWDRSGSCHGSRSQWRVGVAPPISLVLS